MINMRVCVYVCIYIYIYIYIYYVYDTCARRLPLGAATSGNRFR